MPGDSVGSPSVRETVVPAPRDEGVPGHRQPVGKPRVVAKGAIEKALSESEYFLLLASPHSARSSWVQREIDWWIRNRPLDRLLILLTQGELVWDARAADFDWTRTSALPEALLRGRFQDEPLYVDFRWADAADKLSLHHTRFRAAILDVSATLRGIPKDELDGDGQITSVGFGPEGKALAWAAEGNQPIFLWDVATGRELMELVGPEVRRP